MNWKFVTGKAAARYRRYMRRNAVRHAAIDLLETHGPTSFSFQNESGSVRWAGDSYGYSKDELRQVLRDNK